MDLREMKLSQSFEKILPLPILEDCYQNVCSTLDFEEGRKTIKTTAEDEFFTKLSKSTRLKFHRSVWIGRRNVDIFCPGVCGTSINRRGIRMRGLVIEVDGPVHDLESKMRRDSTLLIMLTRLGIGMTSIPNSDLREATVKALLEQFKSFERLDTRGRARLMRNIHILTVARNSYMACVKDTLSSAQINFILSLVGGGFRE